MLRPLLLAFLCAMSALVAASAEAQIRRGDLRLSLDTDMLSIAFVEVENDPGPGEAEYTIFGLGPNQFGGSHAYFGATPLGFGVGYAISGRTILGLRSGLGYDVIDHGGNDNIRVLALSLQPGITFVPIGKRAKLFLSLAGLFQVNRSKHDADNYRVLLGGFSGGIGTLIFPSNRFSADLGFFFEGRFGGIEVDPGDNENDDVRDLRLLVRLGFSLWT